MDAKTRSMFLSWSRLDRHETLLEKTRKLLQRAFSKHENVNVAVSGGKDSLVMLHLSKNIKNNLHVWHWDYGIFMPRTIEREVLQILENFNLSGNLHVDRRHSRSRAAAAGYRAFFATISAHLARNNVTLNLIGLRSEESIARKRRCKDLFETNGNVINMFPLRDWTWKDVWAYIVSNDMPYPSSYDMKGPILGWDQARFVTFFDPEFEHLGGPLLDKFLFWQDREK